MEIEEIKSCLSNIHNADLTKENVNILKRAFDELINDTDKLNSEPELLDVIMQTYLKLYSVPIAIIYYDLEKKKQSVSAGTGILLDLNNKLVVTNKHVIDFFRNEKVKAEENNCPKPILQIGEMAINLDLKIIDENETLDLATIKINEEDLNEISGSSYKEFFTPKENFTKDEVEKNKVVIIIGYPGVYRVDLDTQSLFKSATATLEIMDANDKTIYIELNLDSVKKAFGDDDPNKLKKSLGGFSGGGVFSLSSKGDIQLLGIIKEDGSRLFSGLQASYAYLINEDGKINRQFDLER